MDYKQYGIPYSAHWVYRVHILSIGLKMVH